jgi:hypothetical protein
MSSNVIHHRQNRTEELVFLQRCDSSSILLPKMDVDKLILEMMCSCRETERLIIFYDFRLIKGSRLFFW